MITEDYVSFETAKLLKEKGFDVCVSSFYDNEGEFSRKEADWNWNIGPRYSAPTLQMAMKWLREVHKLFIEVKASIDLIGNPHYAYSVLDSDGKYKRKSYTSFDWTFEEACEVAIKYCLENLI